jgi:phosphoglycolate phosphatase
MRDKMKYKHIIWDWNGTILDDVDLCVDLINWLMKQHGLINLTYNEYREIFTIPVKDYYIKAGFDFTKESFEVVGRQWMDEYERRKYECGLFPGIKDILSRIKSAGVQQSILSAYSQHTLDEIVEKYGLTGYFTHIAGLDNIYAASKVALGKTLIEKINIKEGEALMIGDTLHDYEVAKEIGAVPLLLANGHQSRNKLREGLPEGEKVNILDAAEEIWDYII